MLSKWKKFKKYFVFVLYLLVYFCQIKKNNYFDSFSDFSGNSYIFKFLENEMPEKFIWLVKDFKNIELYLKKLKKDNISSSNIYFVKKIILKVYFYIDYKISYNKYRCKGLKIPKSYSY